MKKTIIKKSYIYALLIFIFCILFAFNNYQFYSFKKALENEYCYNGFSISNILNKSIQNDKKIVYDLLQQSHIKVYDELSNSYPSFRKAKDKNQKIIYEVVEKLPDDIKLEISRFDIDDYFFIDYGNEKLLYFKYISDTKWIFLSIFNDEYFTNYESLSQNQTTRHIITAIFLIISFLTLQYVFSKEEYSKFSQENLSKMEEVANTDKLTGIANRVKGDLSLQKNIELAKRLNQKLSIIFFDIDHFKAINDDFGHNVGDIALQNIANLVKTSCRASDVFIRWGGEEFLIILPNTSLEDALKFANRLRQNIEQTAIIPQRKITCSFGVLGFKDKDNAEEMIKKVDNLLYEAKRKGRNIVVS